MAALIRRFEPVSDTGLRPMPESGLMSQPNSSWQNWMSRPTSGLPSASSRPAYTSSVFSRKITMSTRSGCFTGDGTPLNHRTGRRHT